MALLCAICYRTVDPAKEDVYWAPKILRVSCEDVMVHTICLTVRAAVSDSVVATQVAPKKDVGMLRPEDVLTPAGVTEPPVCFLCRDPVEATDAFALYAGCKHRVAHLACVGTLMDITRSYTCPVCPAQHAQTAKLTAWQRPHQGGYLTVNLLADTPAEPDKDAVVACDRMTVLDMIAARTPAPILCASFEGRKSEQSGPVYGVVARRMVCDVAADNLARIKALAAAPGSSTLPKPECVLQRLADAGYGAEDLQMFGFTLPMLSGDADNWEVLLSPKTFRAEVISRAPLNVSFYRLMVAGVPAAFFCTRGYSVPELSYLRFNVPALIAAGGTPEDLDKLNIPGDKQHTMFLNCRGVQETWVANS